MFNPFESLPNESLWDDTEGDGGVSLVQLEELVPDTPTATVSPDTPVVYDESSHIAQIEKRVVAAVVQGSTILSVRGMLRPELLTPSPSKDVYGAVYELADDTSSMSVDLVASKMKKMGTFTADTDAFLRDIVLDPAQPEELGGLVQEIIAEGTRRNALTALNRGKVRLVDPTQSPQESIASLLFDIDALNNASSKTVTGGEAYELMLQEYEDDTSTLRFGIPELDRKCSLYPGTVNIIGGAPGDGKSTLAGDIIRRNCLHDGVPTHVFSLEMDPSMYQRRLVAAEFSIPYMDILRKNLSGSDYSAFVTGKERFDNAPLTFTDDFSASFESIISEVRLRAVRDGVKLFVFDHVGLIQVAAMASATEFERISYISRKLKMLASELGVVFIVVSQFNREGTKRTRPTISDLRGSSSLEQDADTVLMLYRPKEEGKTLGTELILGKNRRGVTGTVMVDTELQYQRFGIMHVPGWIVPESESKKIMELYDQLDTPNPDKATLLEFASAVGIKSEGVNDWLLEDDEEWANVCKG